MAGTGAGLAVSAATASGSAGYRTAMVGTSSVSQTVAVSGTLVPVDRVDVAFQVAGSVSAANVKSGQKVAAGQVLAAVDPAELQSQVSAAAAALNAADAKLAADEAGQSSGTTRTAAANASPAATSAAYSGEGALVLLVSDTARASTGSGGASGTPGGSGPAPVSGGLAAAQQAVVTAQHRADVDLQTAQIDVAAVPGACAAAGNAPSTTVPSTTVPSTTVPSTTVPSTTVPSTTVPSTTVPSTASPTTTSVTSPTTATSSTVTSTTTTTTTVPGAGGSRAGGGPVVPPSGSGGGPGSGCEAALSRAEEAEGQVAADQRAVADAENSLASVLAASASASGGRSAASTPKASGSSASGVVRSAGASGTSAALGSGSATSASATDTPAQLATDQAAIDSDQAVLVRAQQELVAAELTSPIDGTVASVGLSVGQSVSAGSTSAVITVVSTGAYESTASLTSAQVEGVAVGDPVELSVDGTDTALQGRVASMGPPSASGSVYTYPVTVAIETPTGPMAAGSATRMTLQLAHADSATVVPTSAVHTSAVGTSYVYLAHGARETRQQVTVGLVGPIYTQITSGLAVGDRVVLADPSQPVPASSANAAASGAAGNRPGAIIRNLLGAGEAGGAGLGRAPGGPAGG